MLPEALKPDFNIALAKAQLFAIFTLWPRSAHALLKRLEGGNLDGTLYRHGKCACVLGNLACFQELPRRKLWLPWSRTSLRDMELGLAAKIRALFGYKELQWLDIERLAEFIHEGDTPATNGFSAELRDWTLEFMEQVKLGSLDLIDTFGPRVEVPA